MTWFLYLNFYARVGDTSGICFDLNFLRFHLTWFGASVVDKFFCTYNLMLVCTLLSSGIFVKL